MIDNAGREAHQPKAAEELVELIETRAREAYRKEAVAVSADSARVAALKAHRWDVAAAR